MAKVTPETVTLALTKEEASFLFDVMDRIEGNPKTTRRRYANVIRQVLYAAGVWPTDKNDISLSLRAIYFMEVAPQQPVKYIIECRFSEGWAHSTCLPEVYDSVAAAQRHLDHCCSGNADALAQYRIVSAPMGVSC